MPLRCLLLCLVVLVGSAAAATALTEPVRALTFIETRSDGAERCRTILNEYAAAERQRGRRAMVLQALSALLTAPPDRRSNREFGDAAAPQAESTRSRTGTSKESTASASSASGPDAATREDAETSASVYVVAHLDMTPPERAKGEAALLRLREAARSSAGNLRYDVWQQSDRPNHFNLIAVWTRRSKFNEFAAGAAAREFRKSVASSLGSPYDERLYRRAP